LSGTPSPAEMAVVAAGRQIAIAAGNRIARVAAYEIVVENSALAPGGCRCRGRLVSVDGGHQSLHRPVERPVTVRVPSRDCGDGQPGTSHDLLGVSHRVGMVVELGLVDDLHLLAGDFEVQVEVD
jgi:hypothetical protein